MEVAQRMPGVAGIVLVGGRSRRMGRDKALLSAPGHASLTFVELLASQLSKICTEVLLVARDPCGGKEYQELTRANGWHLVYDLVPDRGPLMGLYSGLRAISFSHALVLAVDLPLAQMALLTWLSKFALTSEVLMPSVENIPQVLLARYPREILPVIEVCLQADRRDLRVLLKHVPVRFFTEEQLRVFDPTLRSFINVNTPEDLAKALQ